MKYLLKVFFAIAFLVLAGLNLSARTFIKGNVTDAKTQEPLIGAIT
jgi:hypothetical protein